MSPEAMAQMRAQAAVEQRLARASAPKGGAARTAPDRRPTVETTRVPDLRLVDSAKAAAARRRKLARRTFLFAAVIVLLGIVCSHAFIDENQFRLDTMKAELTSAQALNAKLTLQVAQLKAPQRIVTTAEMDYGMIVPSSITYLYPVSTSTQLPAPPSGSTR